MLFISWEKQREVETQAEGEAGSMQEAQHGTRSQVSRITPWAAGSAKPLRHWGCPLFYFFRFDSIVLIRIDLILFDLIILDSIRFDCFQFDSIRFDFSQFYSVLFDSIRLYSIQFDWFIFDSIRWESIIFYSIRFDSIIFNPILFD